MTTYRLFPSASGPSSPASSSGPFLCGVMFEVTTGGVWLDGYWWWVCPSGQSTSAQKFALWNVTGNGTGTLIPGSVVTSGTLTAGQWNFTALPAPLQLAIGTTYNACTGFTGNFPDSDAGTDPANCYGTGGHTAGITNGPLHAFSDQPYSSPEQYGNAQGVFATSGTDPSAAMPAQGSASGNFWIDVQVDTAAPAGYSGTYRLYPGKYDANAATVPDSAVNYVVATEIRLSQACVLDRLWYYSPAGTSQLATSVRVWQVLGPDSGTPLVTVTSPAWSGAAGSGWVSCSPPAGVLPAGSYKVSVYNGNPSPDGWSAKDANTEYWDTGAGSAGITWGPVSAPGLPAASLAYEFVSSGAGNTPPYTDGSTTERGQCTFANGTGDFYPYLYVDGLAQNYWTDMEVTPAPLAAPPLTAGGRQQSRLAEAYRFSR